MPKLCTDKEAKAIEQAACERWAEFDPVKSWILPIPPGRSGKMRLAWLNTFPVELELGPIAELPGFGFDYDPTYDVLIVGKYA